SLITQNADDGEVNLLEGSIRFESDDGQTRQLAPGESLRWPLPQAQATKAPEPAALPPSPQRVLRQRAPAPPQYKDADDLLAQVELLRSRGDYTEAARYLEYGLAHERLRPATHEVFSYELGSILTDHLGDRRRACAQ